MSSASKTLFIIRDATSCDWFPLVSPRDAVLLVENGVYRGRQLLPAQCELIYQLVSDCAARSVLPTFDLIDHASWVKLCCEFHNTVRI